MGQTVTRSLLILAAVFVVVTALAELLGAANLGTAAAFGQIAFVATAALLLTGLPGK